MYRHLSTALLTAALALPAFSLPKHGGTVTEDPAVLHPINVRHYEAATGLRRRDDVDFSDLDPNTQSQLIYGRPGDDGQILFANMTLYAPDGLPIVLMERFEGLTSKVDCKGDDGAMSLVFKSEAAYAYALKTWQYINEKDDDQFLLIANHEGCGPDDERQPYRVSKVTDDTTTLTINMVTTIAPWSEVAGTYDIDFGQAIPYQKPTVRPRSFLGDVVNIGKDVLEAAQGNFDQSLPVTFGVSVGKPGTKTEIYKNQKGSFGIDCVDCYVTGSWALQGHIKVEHFTLQDLTLSASPSNFRAKLELEATITATKEPESLNPPAVELFSFPIPGAGIEVNGIFKLGATVAYDVGTSASFAGTATADFGLEASLPNGAKVFADINDPDQSSATGWAGSSLDPIFEVTKLEASITLAAYSQPRVSFGITLDNVGDVEVVVGMKLPEISSILSADYDPKGLCSQTAGASKTGVKLTNKADISVSLSIEADLGDKDNKPKWSKTLFDWTKDLPSSCIPLNIPGLASASGGDPAPSGGSTTPPTTPPAGGTTGQMCKPPGKTGICQSTSTTCAGGDYISGYCPGDSNIKCCPDKAPSAPAPTTSCKPPGKTGICQSTSTTCAGGDYISGYCPGDSSIKCCPDKATSASTPASTCKPPGKTGICQSTSKTCPGGAYIPGYCPGDASNQCCPNDTPTETTTCKPPGKTGVCQKTSTTCAGGAYISGYCPGDDSVKCCPNAATPPTGGGGCKREVLVGVGGMEKRMLIPC